MRVMQIQRDSFAQELPKIVGVPAEPQLAAFVIICHNAGSVTSSIPLSVYLASRQVGVGLFAVIEPELFLAGRIGNTRRVSLSGTDQRGEGPGW